ncbi:hypothetical protein ASPBRDRAFT_192171 [Aspergillus brasiliensis CBS 101740]|uniref:EthD domain-containing protein n=1 Tax=Aspergillus brasiliensis (strain CBS 101740 / IMI 381727 / IBT 21946) TaxID=767769 RepID=A0A1L9UWA9_ASPBC|nr:hypothetical protein ASPBRDRAFT_192171 [Aspergillus brasiliensis CBS 101740]
MAPQKQLVLKLTSFRYKKEGISWKDFHEYGARHHAPMAARIQERHGAYKITHVYTPPITKSLITEKLPWALRPGWKLDDHDVSISMYVPDPETLQAIIADPEFQSLVAGEDHILDQERATVTAGWEEVFLDEGKIVDVERESWEALTAMGQDSKKTSAPEDVRI